MADRLYAVATEAEITAAARKLEEINAPIGVALESLPQEARAAAKDPSATIDVAERIAIANKDHALMAAFKARREIHALIRRLEDAARAEFLAERVAELPPSERAALETPEGREDLARRVSAALYDLPPASPEQTAAIDARTETDPLLAGEIRAVWAAAGADPDRRGELPGPELPRSWTVYTAGVHLGRWYSLRTVAPDHRVLLAYLWPGILDTWRREVPTKGERGVYRFPMEGRHMHRALAARHHGEKAGLPVRWDPIVGGNLRITVSLPEGAQLELIEAVPSLTTRASDFSADGSILPGTVMRLISAVTGPRLSMLHHALWSFAAEDAAEDGRPFDGMFWWEGATRVADRLGYARVKMGKHTRHKSEITARIRRDFEALSRVKITQVVTPPNGRPFRIEGALVHSTKTTEILPRSGPGRQRNERWAFLPELVREALRYNVAIPVDLLSCAGERPDAWAAAFRVYEVLACHARVNADKVAAGELLPLSFSWLLEETRLAHREGERRTATRRVSADATGRKAQAQLVGLLERLAKRGAIRYEAAAMTSGADGVRFTLAHPEAVRSLAAVATARARLENKPSRCRPKADPAKDP